MSEHTKIQLTVKDYILIGTLVFTIGMSWAKIGFMDQKIRELKAELKDVNVVSGELVSNPQLSGVIDMMNDRFDRLEKQVDNLQTLMIERLPP